MNRIVPPFRDSPRNPLGLHKHSTVWNLSWEERQQSRSGDAMEEGRQACTTDDVKDIGALLTD